MPNSWPVKGRVRRSNWQLWRVCDKPMGAVSLGEAMGAFDAPGDGDVPVVDVEVRRDGRESTCQETTANRCA